LRLVLGAAIVAKYSQILFAFAERKINKTPLIEFSIFFVFLLSRTFDVFAKRAHPTAPTPLVHQAAVSTPRCFGGRKAALLNF
jgi:hypothetical protein